MAFKSVQDLGTDNVTALGGVNRKTGKKNPTQVEGYYLGSRKVESKKAKNGFAYIHVIQTPKGNLGVWGKTDLDRKVINVPAGTMVRLTHVGMVATPNGEMYKFQVELDSDNTIEVTGSVQDSGDSHGDDHTPNALDRVGAYATGGSSYDPEEGQDEDDLGEELEQPQAPAKAIQQSAQERTARLQGLLKSKKAN